MQSLMHTDQPPPPPTHTHSNKRITPTTMQVVELLLSLVIQACDSARVNDIMHPAPVDFVEARAGGRGQEVNYTELKVRAPLLCSQHT